MTLSLPVEKNRGKRIRWLLLLGFLIPVVAMICIFIAKGICPFGDNSFLCIDMYHQYAPFLSSFYDKITSGGSLEFAWDIGLGSNYGPLYAYYLASPLYWLVFLFPKSVMIEFMTFLIVGKIGLCGLAMTWYLVRKFESVSYAALIFGVSYALCGYIAAYSWCLMWLDVLVLAPIVLLGLERLVSQRRPLLYCGTLALAVLSNYYIAIILVIFLVLYFVCLLIMSPVGGARFVLSRIALFVGYSVLAAGMACVILVPVIYGMSVTASMESSFPETWDSYFNLIDELTRHFMNVPVEEGLDHWPNIYSGVIIILCLPFYYFNRKVPLKEKIVKTALLAFMFFSFSTNVTSYIWHGFHFPNSLPSRQSFLYTILLLTMCYEGFRYFRHLKKGTIWLTACVGVAFIIVCMFTGSDEDISTYAFIVTAAIVFLYALIFMVIKSKRAWRRPLMALLVGLVAVEGAVNMGVTSITTISREGYIRYNDSYTELLEKAALSDTDVFYRVEKYSRRTKNDAAMIGYYSTSVFSSSANKNISDIYKKLGMEGNTNAYCITGATPFASSLLGVKYVLSTTILPYSELYTGYGSATGVTMYKNNYTLPLGYMISNVDAAQEALNAENPIDAQNGLANALTASGDMLEPIDGAAQANKYTATTPRNGWYFAYIQDSSVKSVTTEVNGSNKTFQNVDRGYLIDLGVRSSSETLELEANEEVENMSATIYRFNDDNFISAYNVLSAQGLNVTSFTNTMSETSVEGVITANSAGSLLLTIPYEEGWTAQVDGVEVGIRTFADAFILLELDAGSHTVKLEYSMPGKRVGILISVCAAGLYVFLIIFHKKRQKAISAAYEFFGKGTWQ